MNPRIAGQTGLMHNAGILFIVGGCVYVVLELFWRGRSHSSMFVAGGLVLMLLGGIGARFESLPLFWMCVVGSVLITALEFITGAVVNVALKLKVWDYSELPLNLYGQVCLRFSLLWFALSAPATILAKLVNAI